VKSAKDLGLEHKKDSLEILIGRLSLLESVSGSIRIVKRSIWEYYYGKTYLWALTGVVPKILWNNKPDLSFGTEFGHASGMLKKTNNVTSISVTYIGEAYLNFGFFGMAIFFLYGIVSSVLYNWVLRRKNSSTRVLIYILILPSAIYLGGTFSLYFCGSIKILILVYFLSKFMTNKRIKRFYFRTTESGLMQRVNSI